MSDFDQELFDGKNMSGIFKDIYENQTHKKKQINVLINELKPFITSTADAVMIIPLVKDFLEVSVKNDEQLIKMAGIAQKVMSAKKTSDSTVNDNGLTDEEKEQLLKNYSKDIDDLISNTLPIKNEIDDINIKLNSTITKLENKE